MEKPGDAHTQLTPTPMRLFALVAILAVGFSTTGCATLFSGSSDTISFTSDPSGAEVVMGGIVQGRTPLTIPVKRAGFGNQTVTLRMDGYDPVTFQLQDGFNTITLLNVFVPIGFVVDAVTGSITKYTRSSYNVDMDRGSVALDMSDLERTEDDTVVLPESQESVVVSDPATGLTYVFGQ